MSFDRHIACAPNGCGARVGGACDPTCVSDVRAVVGEAHRALLRALDMVRLPWTVIEREDGGYGIEVPLTSDYVAQVTDLDGRLPDHAEGDAEWVVRVCTTDGDHIRTVSAPGADDPHPAPRLLALARAVRLLMYEEQGRTPV